MQCMPGSGNVAFPGRERYNYFICTQEGLPVITTILLDADDTLLDFRRAESEAIGAALTYLGVEPTPAIAARYSAINQSQWERLERREITREQVLQNRFDILFAELGVEQDSSRTQKVYESHLRRGGFLLPGALELLETLHGRYRLYLVSNGSGEIQDSRLEIAGICRYFDGIFISQRMGADKPSPAFFERCFSAIPDFRREETIILGDSLTSDILGGKNAGIRTCWFNGRGKPAREDIIPDYTIKALEEFPALLKRL